jgi:TonB family protein
MKNIRSYIILVVVSIHYLFGHQAIAQTQQDAEQPVEYEDVKIKPEFRGETWAFYISHNLKYPEQALKDKVGGKVYVSFVIEKSGDITNVELVQGLGHGLDEEAVRIIKSSPRWRPGYQAKKDPVRVACVMPISFTPGTISQ